MTVDRLPYLPFDGRGNRLRMGLRPLDPADWIEVDEELSSDLADKARLLRDCHSQVVAVVDDPDGKVWAASQELLERLVEYLGTVLTPSMGELHPIDASGRLTQEDWCLHLPDAAGDWRLVAASVCFPTRWTLTDKIGRTLREIHAPVALYPEQLADPMDAYFARMRSGAGVWRLNWNLMDDPTFHQPRHTEPAATVVRPDSAGEQIWLRVERQTLVKLPVSGAIVFSIRIHQDPLGLLRGDAGTLARLRSTLAGMPAELIEYKGLAGCHLQILDWIDRSLASGVDGSLRRE